MALDHGDHLRQTSPVGADFHIRSFDTTASRDQAASEGVIRTNDLAYVDADEQMYRYNGATFDGLGRIQFRPDLPASPSTTIVTTQAAFDAALDAFADGYTGVHEIEVRFTPLTIDRPLPKPSAADSTASLTIIADRSTVEVANASPNLVAVGGGPNAQFEDASFGAHGGIGDDTHWSTVDLGGGLPVIPFPLVPTSSPAVRMVSSFGIIWSTTVYPYSVTLNLTTEQPLLGDFKLNQFNGTRLVGFIVNPNAGLKDCAVGVTFAGCRFNNRTVLRDCAVSGVLTAGTNSIDISGSIENAGIDNFYAPSVGQNLYCYGTKMGVGPLVSYARLHLLEWSSVRGTSPIDFYVGASAAIEMAIGARAQVGLIYLAGSATALLEWETATSGNYHISFLNTVTGSCSGDAVRLQRGAIAEGLSNLSGLTVGGSELLVDGAAFNFADVPIFSLDTGARADD